MYYAVRSTLQLQHLHVAYTLIRQEHGTRCTESLVRMHLPVLAPRGMPPSTGTERLYLPLFPQETRLFPGRDRVGGGHITLLHCSQCLHVAILSTNAEIDLTLARLACYDEVSGTGRARRLVLMESIQGITQRSGRRDRSPGLLAADLNTAPLDSLGLTANGRDDPCLLQHQLSGTHLSVFSKPPEGS
jgi:hypothetical protein